MILRSDGGKIPGIVVGGDIIVHPLILYSTMTRGYRARRACSTRKRTPNAYVQGLRVGTHAGLRKPYVGATDITS